MLLICSSFILSVSQYFIIKPFSFSHATSEQSDGAVVRVLWCKPSGCEFKSNSCPCLWDMFALWSHWPTQFNSHATSVTRAGFLLPLQNNMIAQLLECCGANLQVVSSNSTHARVCGICFPYGVTGQLNSFPMPHQ